MNRSMFFVAVCGVVLLGWWGHSAAPAPLPVREKGQPVANWEYKVMPTRSREPADLEKDLNDLGGEGWELVNFTGGTSTPTKQYPFFRAVLKRPKR
jgi:hypothetical protein